MHRSTFGSGFGVEFSDRAWGLGGRSRVQDLRSRLQGSRKLGRGGSSFLDSGL